MTVLEGAAMRTECGSSTSLATDHCNAAAVELLDEFWFFKNALILSQAPKCADDAGVYSKENGKEQAVVQCPNRVRDESSPPLQRMPTLQPRLQRMHTVQEAITSLKSCNLKLRYSLSSLDNYQSSSSSKVRQQQFLSTYCPSLWLVTLFIVLFLERSQRQTTTIHKARKVWEILGHPALHRERSLLQEDIQGEEVEKPQRSWVHWGAGLQGLRLCVR